MASWQKFGRRGAGAANDSDGSACKRPVAARRGIELESVVGFESQIQIVAKRGFSHDVEDMVGL